MSEAAAAIRMARTSCGARLALTVVAIALLAGCFGPQPRQAQFVGKWKSSRLATPLHLHANGEWEIKGDDQVLQYGVWQLEGQRMLWSIRIDGRISHDQNDVLSVSERRFELRERDGSRTVFDRLD